MQTLKSELVNFGTVAKLPKVAGILRGYVNTDMPDSAMFQTGISFGIRGDKNVDSLTVPIKILIKILLLITMVVHCKLIKQKQKAIQDFFDDKNDKNNTNKATHKLLSAWLYFIYQLIDLIF